MPYPPPVVPEHTSYSHFRPVETLEVSESRVWPFIQESICPSLWSIHREKLFNSTKPTLCMRLGQEIWDCKLKLHGKFEWVTHTKTTCFSLCIPACTREAHNLALFILVLLPVGGNPLLLGSQMRSWAISREGHLCRGGGEPRAWLVLCSLLHISPLKERKRLW